MEKEIQIIENIKSAAVLALQKFDIIDDVGVNLEIFKFNGSFYEWNAVNSGQNKVWFLHHIGSDEIRLIVETEMDFKFYVDYKIHFLKMSAIPVPKLIVMAIDEFKEKYKSEVNRISK